jgi:bifunctional non-homologous end joining protein LigD
VRVAGHTLTLTNLTKVLYPGNGFTKAEVLDYYARIAPYLLPHLADRPLTRKRWPDGTAAGSFFEKNAPRGRPAWVRTARLPVPGSTRNRDEIDFVLADGPATLTWLANLAALELHVPQWRVQQAGSGRTHRARALPPDLLVLDLDPGPPADLVDCCEVAQHARDAIEADLGPCLAKVSGSKGLHLYARWPADDPPAADPAEYAQALAGRLADRLPKLVIAQMARHLRPGKVFVDWSQNNPAKTTVAPYSLRGLQVPTVSAPVTWAEVETCADPYDLVFTPADALRRCAADGDLFAPLST